MSLKQSFVLYTLVFILIATLISLLLLDLYDVLQQNLYMNYFDPDDPYQLDIYNNYGVVYSPYQNLSSADQFWNGLLGTLRIITLPLVFLGCSVLASLLFYRNKLQRPVSLLHKGAEKIAANDLNFTIDYDSQDELGRLCRSYNDMRASLEQNNRKMWRFVEERRRLNASFSHDLRTPLTVLRGYTDMLRKYIPADRYPKEKLISTVNTMSDHINRLENYVSAMNTLYRLEDITVEPRPVEGEKLAETLRSTAEILCREANMRLQFRACLDGFLQADAEVVLQVFENMMSNAVRFANGSIEVDCARDAKELTLVVTDDGRGFLQEDLRQAAAPYYRGRPSEEDTHFGLGLNICKLLCEKHGGYLKIANSRTSGAMVTAVFALGCHSHN